MRGRKPTPTSAKILRGTFRKDRANPDEVMPDVILNPPAPSYLSKAARQVWKAHAPPLAELGLLTELDHEAFAIYCQALADSKEATRRIAAEGEVIRLPNGLEQRNPWLKIRNDAWRVVKEVSQQFGLTPSARVRVRATPPTKRSPLADY